MNSGNLSSDLYRSLESPRSPMLLAIRDRHGMFRKWVVDRVVLGWLNVLTRWLGTRDRSSVSVRLLALHGR